MPGFSQLLKIIGIQIIEYHEKFLKLHWNLDQLVIEKLLNSEIDINYMGK